MIDRRLNLYLPGARLESRSSRVEMIGSQSATLTQARGRLMMVRVCFTLAYLIMAIRAFDLMVLQGALNNFSDSGHLDTTLTSTVSAPRRDIVDRHGTLLATSIKTVSLYADPHLILDTNETARSLARLFPEHNEGELIQKFQTNKRFVWLKRNLTPKEQAAVLELGQPGLAFQEEYRRIYPQGGMAAHVVGYSGVDSQGLSGAEQGYNASLKKDGAPLELTIDLRLQHVLRREIEKTMRDFTAQGGAGLIMNAQNGEILAAVSLPDFDPHGPGQAKPEAKFNRFSLGTYELGSTFKIFTTAALIEQQNTPMSAVYDTREPIRVGRFTISDYHPENRPQTVPEVFMHSSNIGTALMAQQIGTEGLRNFFDDLGLLKPATFDLPEVGKPLLPRPWREISTLTASYGHGIAVSPLQVAAATAAIIGDGTLVTPHVLADRLVKSKPDVRIVSPETTQKMRALMRLAVRKGTGSKADVPGLMVGGKTGTAEKSINGRYEKKALISSFVAAFPMNDPRYIVVVMIDDPKPNKSSFGYATAGWTAVPATHRVIASMANLYGIIPDERPVDLATSLEKYLAGYIPPDSETPETGAIPIASIRSVP